MVNEIIRGLSGRALLSDLDKLPAPTLSGCQSRILQLGFLWIRPPVYCLMYRTSTIFSAGWR